MDATLFRDCHGRKTALAMTEKDGEIVTSFGHNQPVYILFIFSLSNDFLSVIMKLL